MQAAIAACSLSRNIEKTNLDQLVVEDADLLESVGATAIPRTFSSNGQVRAAFHHRADPRAECRELDPQNYYALDLFGARLFKVTGRLQTDTARSLAAHRERFLHEFFKQFLLDIDCEE